MLHLHYLDNLTTRHFATKTTARKWASVLSVDLKRSCSSPDDRAHGRERRAAGVTEPSPGENSWLDFLLMTEWLQLSSRS